MAGLTVVARVAEGYCFVVVLGIYLGKLPGVSESELDGQVHFLK